MTSDIDINIRVRDTDLGKLEVAEVKVKDLGRAAKEAGDDAKSGAQGWSVMGGAVADFVGGAALDLARQLPQIIIDLYDMGVESLRAKAGFEAWGGSADTIVKMQDATKGLVDDTALLANATELMSANILHSEADMAEFARIGATLGITFQGDATKGVETLTAALEAVGNVRGLRQLGVDTLAVKSRFDELKKTMGEASAWKSAIFEVAGESANKLSEKLDGAGTSVDRLKTRFDDAKESLGEWVAEGIDKAATSLEQLEKIWDALQVNPNLVLTVTIQEIKNAATKAVADDHAALKSLRNPYEPYPGMYGAGSKDPMGAYQDYYDMTHPQVAPLPKPWRSVWQRNHPNSGGGEDDSGGYAGSGWRSVAQMRSGDDPYAQTTADIRGLKGQIASQNINKAVDPWAEGLKSLLGITDAFKGVNSLASEYDLKMRQVLAPLQEQQRILEARAKIQSVDDAFGVKRDGLYAEVGSGMEDAIAQRRAAMEAELEKTGRRYGRRSKKYKAAEADLEEFDAGAKEAVDDYAVATGAATRESIKFRDQLDAAKKAFAEGKTSLEQYKNELLLLGEAAKQGVTSMDQLTQLQRRLNLDLRPGAKSDADKSVFDQYAGGVKTKGSASGAAGEKETKPFDAVVTSANEAASAATKVGTQGAAAVGMLAVAGVLAAGSLGQVRSQGADALEQVVRLQQELKTLASISINITTTPRGGSDNTTRPTRGPR